MGIQGLLPLLKSIHDHVHLAAYANQRVAVDTYVWLHRGTYNCATELCLGRPTERYLEYCLSLVDLLLHYKISPVMVLDGACLPQKKVTEDKRRIARQANKAKGRVCFEEGNHSAAMKFFQKAVDITPEMAHKLLHHLRLRGVEFIVAPYEADAQLAFLSISNYVSAVISEDSDLLVFGCKRVLYKMDRQGHGMEIRLANIAANEPFNFANWTQTMLQLMAVLAGCDYLPSLEGMGIKKAYQEVQQCKTLERVLARLRSDARFTMPPGYEERFKMAIMTFNYQRVFDPVSRRLVSLHPLPPDLNQDSSFLGPVVEDSVAEQIARGLIHPDTHRSFDEQHSYSPFERHSPKRLSSAPRPLPAPPPLPAPAPTTPASSAYDVSAFYETMADYSATGGNSNALFPGLEPLPSAGSKAVLRPFVRPAQRGDDEKGSRLSSSERWTELFHKSRISEGVRQGNKENERVHINLLEDDDDAECAKPLSEPAKREVIDLLEEKDVPRPRPHRVGLAKSALISSRTRLTVPRASGLLGGAPSPSHMWSGALATFSFSSSSTTSTLCTSPRGVIHIDVSSPPSSKQIVRHKEVLDVTALSPSPKRRVRSPSKHAPSRAHLVQQTSLPVQKSGHTSSPIRASASPSAASLSISPSTSHAAPRYSSDPGPSKFSFPPTPSFCFSSAPLAAPYSKPFEYALIDDCPSPCSELDEDALTPTHSPRSPRTTRKSRSVISPPGSPVCIAESPPCHRFSFGAHEDRFQHR